MECATLLSKPDVFTRGEVNHFLWKIYPLFPSSHVPCMILWSLVFLAGGYHGYDESGYGPPPPPHYSEGRRMGPPMRGRGGAHSYGGGPGYGPPPPPPGEYSAHADSPVVMVYGLEPAKMNADKVFNVFCLYGNVERVSEGKRASHCSYFNKRLLVLSDPMHLVPYLRSSL